MVSKKDYIIERYDELKTKLNELLTEEKSDLLFIPKDELILNIEKYFETFNNLFMNTTLYHYQ